MPPGFSFNFNRRIRPDRGSDAPLSIDVDRESSHHEALIAWVHRLPPSWLGMWSYLAGGLFLGLVLILALTLTRGVSPTRAAGIVTDNVVYLRAKQMNASCWRGVDVSEPARLTVALEIGVEGNVQKVVAAGESPSMRACVEAHLGAWEFLPQATPSQIVLPVEISTP